MLVTTSLARASSRCWWQCTERAFGNCQPNCYLHQLGNTNQMIVSCGDIIRNQLLLKIQSTRYFLFVAGEAPTLPMTATCQSVFGTYTMASHKRSFWVFMNIILVLLVRLLLRKSSLNWLFGSWIHSCYGVKHLMARLQWQQIKGSIFMKNIYLKAL